MTADVLDDAVGSWLSERGAAKAGAAEPHLVAVVDQETSTVLAQRGRREVQRDHPAPTRRVLPFPGKGNRPSLFAAHDQLPWATTVMSHTTTENPLHRRTRRPPELSPHPPLRSTAVSIIRLMNRDSDPEANAPHRDHPLHALQALDPPTPTITACDQLQLAS